MNQMLIETKKVLYPADRNAALEVVREVFLGEKQWIDNCESEIPAILGSEDRVSWFLTHADEQPVGLLRLTYDPPLELPSNLDLQLEKDLDLEHIAATCRFVEIGRFMILPAYRGNIRIAMDLMRGAVAEVVERGYSHFLTTVFENDPHSPLKFHTRVLGFERIGTHRFGELHCSSQRILLVMDIASAYMKLKGKNNRVFRQLCAGLEAQFEALPMLQVA